MTRENVKPEPEEKKPEEPEMVPPEELSEEDLRLMADTMPGDGPGDD
jgi:hypothetical protein